LRDTLRPKRGLAETVVTVRVPGVQTVLSGRCGLFSSGGALTLDCRVGSQDLTTLNEESVPGAIRSAKG
jgi:hypothetical protein